jgi:chromate transporter
MQSAWQLFIIFLKLGTSSFGGPIAHLAYFRAEFVDRRRWLTEHTYSELVALCQFLPGPASSQVGIAIGLTRGGYLGALSAWLGFTLPSALVLILFALGYHHLGSIIPKGAIIGLKIVAVAVVAQAVWAMNKQFCTNKTKIGLMILSACLVLINQTIIGQMGIILISGALGLLLFKPDHPAKPEPLPICISKTAGLLWGALFLLMLILLPIFASDSPVLALWDSFYRAGSLVFGGGHVVLPLLQTEMVNTGHVTQDTFVAGYALTQAMPGPLFTFAGFLGASQQTLPTGLSGGAIALCAIFMPSFLLIFAALPLWTSLRNQPKLAGGLLGVNVGVVGLLLAALYDPIWTSAIHQPEHFSLLLLAFISLTVWKHPVWLIVAASAVIGAIML